MNIAITGASGHIGNCLWRALVREGHQVRALVHKIHIDNGREGLEEVPGDLMDADSLCRLFKGSEIVFHLAARIGIDRREKALVYRTNVEGTLNVAEACKRAGVRRLIHFSSIHALQSYPLDGILDEARPLVEGRGTAYELSKAEGERIVLAAANDSLEVVILNPTAVIGPYDEHHSYLGQAVIMLYNNTLPMLVPGGYDWVDVRDVVDGALSAITKGRSGERYLLPGAWVSLKELSCLIGSITGRKTPQRVVPGSVALIGLPFIQAWAQLSGRHPLYTRDSLTILRTSHPNISPAKAHKELGYFSRPLSETLADTFAWYQQKGILR